LLLASSTYFSGSVRMNGWRRRDCTREKGRVGILRLLRRSQPGQEERVVDPLRTLQCLLSGLPGQGDRPAVLALHKEESERWSYAELADRVRRLAQGLTEMGGVGRG